MGSSLDTFIHSPIHSFIQFSIYGMPDTVLDAGEATKNKTDKICVFLELTFKWQEKKKQINS